jgi:hypothetical protein
MKKASLGAKKDLILKIMAAPSVQLQGLEVFFKPDEMPELDASPIGRHRLLQAFRNKYGETYRNKKGVSKIIKDFDDQRDFIIKALKARVE